jgi:hypothetical protein
VIYRKIQPQKLSPAAKRAARAAAGAKRTATVRAISGKDVEPVLDGTMVTVTSSWLLRRGFDFYAE